MAEVGLGPEVYLLDQVKVVMEPVDHLMAMEKVEVLNIIRKVCWRIY